MNRLPSGNFIYPVSVSILTGAAVSNSLNLESLRLFGIVMPAAWTAASLTFQASFDGGTTWVNMYESSGTEISVTASTSRYIALDPVIFASITMIKVRSGTSGTPVNQTADRALGLVLRSI